MKDGMTRLKSLKRLYSSGSIIEQLSYTKSMTRKNSDLSTKKESKNDFFPNNKLNNNSYIRNRFIINPDSEYKILWDCILLICLLLRLFIIPYYISFSMNLLNGSASLLITDYFFLLDIIIKLNTGIHFKGFLLTNRVKIIRNYLANTFIIDFFASFPIQELPSIQPLMLKDYSEPSYFRLVLIIKFAHIYRIKSIFYELEDRFTSIHAVTFFKFFHFSILISLLVHWTSCLVHFVYQQELLINGDLWPTYIENEANRYMNYLYYILFTVTSIGYYALNIVSSEQRLVNILIMCFDIIVFAYILGKIESTLDSYQKEGNETKRLISKCKAFIAKNKIPNSLRHKIIRYILYRREKEVKGANNENLVLGSLSLPLREEIFTQTRGQILCQSKIFQIYRKSFIKFIGSHLKLQYFGPQDKIFDTGENGSFIYFIQNGEIEIFHESTSTTFKVLKKGKSFGEIAFFLGTVRTASAKSVNFSEILALDRVTLNKILLSRPNEKDLTDQIISQAHLLGLAVLHIKCYFCKRLGHTAGSCKHYIIRIDKKKLIKKVDNSRYCKSKKINLHEAFKFTFSRNESRVNRNVYSLINTKGKVLNVKEKYKKKQGLMRKALNFQFRVKPEKIVTKKNIWLADDSSSEEESSAIPAYLQLRNAFLENSKKKREDHRQAIELFDEGDLPKIYLTSPPENNM